MKAGDVVLADALFDDYFIVCELCRRGIDIVARAQHERVGTRIARNNLNDDIIVWQRPNKPRGMTGEQYRSLANTIRALRRCMRNLNQDVDSRRDLLSQLAEALVQKYENRTDKRARYRPPNPDKKPLGEPNVTKLTPEARKKLAQLAARIAA